MNLLLKITLLILCLPGFASADNKMYYTFEGTITTINDLAGAIAAVGLEIGSPVTYTIVMDLDAQGSTTYNNGNVTPKIDTAEKDYFYTDFISGTVIEPINGGYFNEPGSVAEYNFAVNQDEWILDKLKVTEGFKNDQILVNK